MKKTISSVTAFSLLATSMPVYASPVEAKPNNDASDLVGNLEVDVNFALPIMNTTEELTGITLSLTDAQGKKHSVTLGEKTSTIEIDGKSINYIIKKLDKTKTELESDAEKVYYYTVVFNDLPVGNYSLSLSGEGFKTTDEIKVKLQDYSQRVTLSNQESFLMGDFDQDGKVTQKDYNALIDNIKTTDAGTIKKFDLNRDGAVSILDLSYVQENLNKTASGALIVETNPIIDTTKMMLDASSSVGIPEDKLDTALENLMTGKEPVGVEVTPEKPAQIGMSFEEPVKMDSIDIAVPNSEKAPSSGKVIIEDEHGDTTDVYYGDEAYRNAIGFSAKMNRSAGNILIDLKGQIAVKKITIVVSATTDKNASLAEIGKVEFLNNVYEEIPAPEMNIPTITAIEEGSEELTVKWNAEPNVDGYEVKVIGNIKGKETTKIIQTSKTEATFTSLDNYETYRVSIQSMNGEWTSGYSAETTATPKPTGKPEAPEGVSIKGIYKGLEVSWKKHKNADTFNLYYKKVESDEEYTAIENLKQLNYTLTNLEDDTEYEIYLTAVNEHGISENSQVYKGKTMDLTAPVTPNYKLINVSNGINQPTAHIKGVSYPNTPVEGDEFAVVDNDYSSSWILKSWEAGGYNDVRRSPIVEFDSAQTLDTIVVIPDASQKYQYGYVKVFVQENGKMVEKPASFKTKKDKNDKIYYEVRLNKPVTTDKVQVNFAMAWIPADGGTISISEMKFYQYDSLEQDVSNLFEDDLLVKLNDNVTLDTINDLRERANEVDPVSGEHHPYRETVLLELDYAEQLYTDSKVDSEIMVVNQNITNTGNNIGMSNDNQALGLSARAGDELIVYVGSNGVLPELVFTQYYAESGKFEQKVKLQKGRNVIQVPKIHNMDVEKGGNIYVRYPSGSSTKGDVKVRVMGATKIPHLNLYGMINDEDKQDEVKTEIRKYITELQTYVDQLPSLYPTKENKSENKYLYDKKTSVLNTTDIELDKATFNVSATAVLEGLKGSTIDDKVDQLYNSLKAMEQLMDLKYAERGVSKNPDFDKNGKVEGDELKHAYPKSRANIKYQRMFIGAFMYGSSNHVGIEYDSIGGLTTGIPFTFNNDGTVKDSGQLFGWGIAHEIGHMTDLPTIGTAEVTNNIIALLAQTFDDQAHSRLEDSGKYEQIYEKVTSGTIGLPSDVFAQLGMYWQLHLAYDKNPTALMLQTDTDSDPTNDSIFAKISKRVRTLTAEERALSKEQLLVRVASDAAGKDLSDFFYAWGIRPDEATKKYLTGKGYEKESRSIQYLNDDARRKVLNDKVKAMADGTEVTVTLNQTIPEDSVVENKDITLNLGVTSDEASILGYEIYRNGKVVGFTTENTFTDSLGAINNRVVEYSVKAIDYHLNETDVKKLDPIKVSHDGTMDKQGWSVETNMTSEEDVTDENNNHGAFLNPSVNKVIDSKDESVFTGTKPTNADGHVIISMDGTQPIVGFRYVKPNENAMKGYEVYVSTDKENWTLANAGTFDTSKEEETIYFNKEGSDGGKQLWSYNASYVKIVAKGTQTVSIPEIDIIAPPGDNIEIGTRAALYKDGIGTLKSDFIYDKVKGEKIPQGSLIITGSYRGHPAFNASILRDQNGNIMSTETIFMAELPNNAELGEISEGTYITWITPDKLKELASLPTKVMTEMYRVNDAITLEGQRLVSDTLYIDVPTKLPEIEFTDSSTRSVLKKSTITHGIQGFDIYKDFKQIK